MLKTASSGGSVSMSRQVYLAVWPVGDSGSKARDRLLNRLLRIRICRRMAPCSPDTCSSRTTSLYVLLSSLLHSNGAEVHSFCEPQGNGSAGLAHSFPFGKVDVTLTVSGRPAASTLCVWLDSLMIEKYFWQLAML